MQLPLGLEAERPARRHADDDVPGIRVGTCGYSYADWIGPFYPAGIRRGTMLEYYANAFSAVEIDTTYYGVPSRETFETMAARTPAGFRFSVKVPGAATHLPAAVTELPPDVAEFRAAIEPLREAGKLACALMQFPAAFKPSPDAARRLRALRDGLPDVPLVAEFRHRDWQASSTIELLEALGVGWCNVDLPGFAALPHASSDATSEIGYVRFHGRNAQQWWRPQTSDLRYDYTYSAEELEPWVERVADLSATAGVRETLAFFNNHRRGQAIRNAEMFRAMLEARLGGAGWD